jgi:hypothetical protein
MLSQEQIVVSIGVGRSVERRVRQLLKVVLASVLLARSCAQSVSSACRSYPSGVFHLSTNYASRYTCFDPKNSGIDVATV